MVVEKPWDKLAKYWVQFPHSKEDRNLLFLLPQNSSPLFDLNVFSLYLPNPGGRPKWILAMSYRKETGYFVLRMYTQWLDRVRHSKAYESASGTLCMRFYFPHSVWKYLLKASISIILQPPTVVWPLHTSIWE